jgi:pimeloyl-ACP methyl ester carboxylesterase
MMAEPHFGRVPWEAIEQIGDWLAARSLPLLDADENADETALTTHHESPAAVTLAMHTSPYHHDQAEATIREQPLWLKKSDGSGSLFGIHTMPLEPCSERPTIVLLNSGAAQRVGPGRLYVHLARRLASEGFSSVRLDVSGLGDSVLEDVAAENNPYGAHSIRDVQQALLALRQRCQVKRTVLMGLCSGAYLAFQSAVQLDDPTLVESVLINPLTFFWRDGMSLDATSAQAVLKEHGYLRRRPKAHELLRFLLGRTQLSYADAVRLVLKSAGYWFNSWTKRAEPTTDGSTPSLCHPTTDDLPRDLCQLTTRGRRLSLFLGENDPGLTLLSYKAPRQLQTLRSQGTLHVATITGGDHTFSRRAPRRVFIDEVASYLQSRFPRACL